MGGEFLVKNHKVTELESERYWAKFWEDMVGTGMTLGFWNLGKVRDKREKRWNQEERRGRKSKAKQANKQKTHLGEVFGKVEIEREKTGGCKVRDSEKGG